MLLPETDPLRGDPVRVACEPIETLDRDPHADTSAEGALLSAHQQIEGLHAALRTRTVIAQAVGMLMHEKTLTPEGAFAELVEMSSHTNVKIRDIASRMVEEATARACARRGHTD